MTPHRAGQIAAHNRRLLTARIIDPYDYAVLDCLLFRLRRTGHELARGSYAVIARTAGIGLTRAKEAIARLTGLGLLAKAKHRLLVRWGWNQSHVASRQAPNTYEFLAPSTEAAARPVLQGIEQQASKTLTNHGDAPLLAARRAAWEAGLVGRQSCKTIKRPGERG